MYVGWKFKGICGLFTDYIDKWVKVKTVATLSGNKGLRTLAKLMLNSLYRKVCNGNGEYIQNTIFRK